MSNLQHSAQFPPTSQLTMTLEWFLNPDHLPFIAGIKTGAYQRAGVELTIIEPDDHYDGFAELNKRTIDLHTNEPLHLFEHYAPNLRSLGCFFETDGGILMRGAMDEVLHKLQHQSTIRICTPAAEEKTNRIGFEVLSRYAKQHGIEISPDTIEFVQADFYHITNMQNDLTLDGAWLCFYNFEGVEAKHAGMDFTFIDQNVSPFANFSALDIITTDEIYHDKKQMIDRFIEVTNEMIQLCRTQPDIARELYYQYTDTSADTLMNAIIDNTLDRFVYPVVPKAEKWQNLREMLAQIDIVSLTDAQYQSLWKL